MALDVHSQQRDLVRAMCDMRSQRDVREASSLSQRFVSLTYSTLPILFVEHVQVIFQNPYALDRSQENVNREK